MEIEKVGRALTLPEGVDAWNKADERSKEIRKSAERVLNHIREGKDVILPYGWVISEFHTPWGE